MAIQTTTFKGARYIVKFHDPIEWADTESYEAIEAVQHEAFTYISKQPVPAGVQIDNEEFWLLWADPNAQMEQLRQTVESYKESLIEKAQTFANTDAMANSGDLENGMICHTNGFYISGDGGAAWYVISDTLPVGMTEANETDVISCGELYAILIVESELNVACVGCSANKTNAQNLAIINSILAESKYSQIYIPSFVNYGYHRGQTKPQIDASTIKCIIVDDSIDDSYDSAAQVGMQRRLWFNTPTQGTNHDGNNLQIKARHHPALLIHSCEENEYEETDFRASVFFGKNDTNLWRVGQGIYGGDNKFLIARFNAQDTEASTVFAIDHETGNICVGGNYTGFKLGVFGAPIVVDSSGNIVTVFDTTASEKTINYKESIDTNGVITERWMGSGKRARNLDNGVDTFYTSDGLITITHNSVYPLNVSNVGRTSDLFKIYNDSSGWFKNGVSGGQGATTARPTNPQNGAMFYDATINKPIWWTGSHWVDATGATV